ncbi:MAG: 4-phosphoerythronate dehydrogenase [Chromatocurvus sp.]
MKLVVDENISGLDGLAGAGLSLRRMPGRDINAADIQDADALLIRSVTPVNAALLAGATRLRFVGTATSGFDHVDRALLQQRGIAFAHAPGSNANSVAEYVLSAIAETGEFLERLLDGGRVGIVGYGHIGQCLGQRLDALGIAWSVSDPWRDPASVPCAATLSDVLSADVVTLHAELTDSAPYPSRHLLHAGNLDQVSGKTLLINASRGAVVDNAALRARLDAADAPVAILDVWEGEPLLDIELLGRVRFGSAHIAGYSWDGKLLATRMLLADMAVALAMARPPVISETPPVLTPDGADAEGATLVRSLLSACYRLADDDRRLREAMEVSLSAESRGRAFDGLRRCYRKRRELAGSVVVDPGWRAAQRRQAEALGVLMDR